MLVLLTFVHAIDFLKSDNYENLTIRGLSNEIISEEDYLNSGTITLYKHISIEYGITTIGQYAFRNSLNLLTVDFADSISSIGNGCFINCESLEYIILPKKLSIIHNKMFQGCKKLKNITIQKDVYDVEIESTFSNNNEFLKYIVDIENPYFSSSPDQKVLIKNRTIAISGAGSCNTLRIPAEITSISQQFLYYRSNVKTIIFEGSNIERLEDKSFAVCGITTLEIPYGVNYIGHSAFAYSDINKISIPSTVTSVHQNFMANSQIRSVTVDPRCPALNQDSDGAIFNSNYTSLLFIPPTATKFTIPANLESIDMAFIRSNSNFKEIKVDTQNEKFVDFDNMIFLKENMTLYSTIGGKRTVEIPANCTGIMASAFEKSFVENVTILSDLFNEIPSHCFASTPAFNNITFSRSISKLSMKAFYRSKIKKITIPSSIKQIGNYCFGESSIAEIDLSQYERSSMESHMFAYCYSLNSIILPPNIESIPEYTFNKCPKLRHVSVPPNVCSLGNSCFEGSGIEEVTFESSNTLKSIGQSCFKDSKLISFEAPNSVEEIGEEAFSLCPLLTNLTFGEESLLRKIPGSFLAGSPNVTHFMIGKEVEEIEDGAFGQTLGLIDIEVTKLNEHFNSSEGAVFEVLTSSLVAFGGGRKETIIPNWAKSIRSSAFLNCENLKEVTFEAVSSLRSICSSAFSGCRSLETIEIPESVTEVMRSAFNGCKSLSFVSMKSATNVGPSAFSGCSSLSTVSICADPTKPNTVDGTAFNGCNELLYISVPTNFIGEAIGGKKVFRIIDADCNFPSHLFTHVPRGTGDTMTWVGCQLLVDSESD